MKYVYYNAIAVSKMKKRNKKMLFSKEKNKTQANIILYYKSDDSYFVKKKKGNISNSKMNVYLILCWFICFPMQSSSSSFTDHLHWAAVNDCCFLVSKKKINKTARWLMQNTVDIKEMFITWDPDTYGDMWQPDTWA